MQERGDNTRRVRWDSDTWQSGFTMIPNTILLDASLSATALRLYMIFVRYSWRPDFEWPGQDALAELAGCSERTVRSAVRQLEARRLIVSQRRGLGKTNVYVLLEPGSADIADQASRTADVAVQERPGVAAPSVSLEMKEQDGTAYAVLARVRAPDHPATVDRRPVTEHEYLFAKAVLTIFNQVAGTSFASKDWISKIVMRHREHPGVTIEQHRMVIERAFADPWWRGPASPSVVYGSGAQFERSVHALLVEPERSGNAFLDAYSDQDSWPDVLEAEARELTDGED